MNNRSGFNISLKFQLYIQEEILNRSVGWKYKCESHRQENERGPNSKIQELS